MPAPFRIFIYFFFQPEACGKNVTVKLFLNITKHLCNVAIMSHYFANLLDSCINVTPGYFHKYCDSFSQCCINITFITIIEMLRSFCLTCCSEATRNIPATLLQYYNTLAIFLLPYIMTNNFIIIRNITGGTCVYPVEDNANQLGFKYYG